MVYEEKEHVANQIAHALNAVESFSGAETKSLDGQTVTVEVNHDEHGKIVLEVN